MPDNTTEQLQRDYDPRVGTTADSNRLIYPDFSLQRMFTSAAQKVVRDSRGLFASQPLNTPETDVSEPRKQP